MRIRDQMREPARSNAARGGRAGSAGRPSKAERIRLERRRSLRWRVLAIAVGVAAAGSLAAVLVTTGSDAVGPSPAGSVDVDGPPRVEPLAAGETMPAFSGPALDGGRVAWIDVRGAPAVLAVWAPWCPHCQVELPVLGRVAADHPTIRVLTVVTAIGQAPGPDPGAFMRDHGLSMPTVIDDESASILRGLGVEGFPTTFFVGSDGVVRAVTTGETPEAELRARFAELG